MCSALGAGASATGRRWGTRKPASRGNASASSVGGRIHVSLIARLSALSKPAGACGGARSRPVVDTVRAVDAGPPRADGPPQLVALGGDLRRQRVGPYARGPHGRTGDDLRTAVEAGGLLARPGHGDAEAALDAPARPVRGRSRGRVGPGRTRPGRAASPSPVPTAGARSARATRASCGAPCSAAQAATGNAGRTSRLPVAGIGHPYAISVRAPFALRTPANPSPKIGTSAVRIPLPVPRGRTHGE